MYRTLGSTGIEMYTLVGGLGWIFVLIYNFLMFSHKQKMLSNSSLALIKAASAKNESSIFARENFWVALEIIIISFIQIFPNGFMNVTFGNIMKTGANYFGLLYFVPLILFAFFFLISVNPLKQTDLITPAYPLALFFVKLGCFCNGCCGGFECEWGLMNYYFPSDPKREFPIQLVEAGLALIIFFFLMWYRKRAKEGTMFPIYLIVYSSTRFFSEFFRQEEDIFWILKKYHFFCLAGIVLGIIEYFIAVKYIDCIKSFLDKAFEAMVLWFNKSVIKNHLKKEKEVIIHHNKKKKKNQKKTTYRK